MNRKTVALSVLIIGFASGYFILGDYSNIPDGTPSQKADYVLKEAKCQMCHSKHAEPPFYASIPIVGGMIKKDMEIGLRNFDISPAMEALAKGLPPDESSLAKIEYVVEEDLMPPTRFKILHWTSNISAPERAAIFDWVLSERKKLNLSSDVSETFENEPVRPIPLSIKVDPNKAELGSILYHHTALSGDGTVSCATCHPLDRAGVDALQTSTGIRDQKGDINAPTVYNAVFNFKQFWNGRAKTLEEQAGGPPMNPLEMDAGSWSAIVERLSKDSDFESQFRKVYPDGFSEKNITDAIGQFERTLITPNSPFDRYLRGDDKAISNAQKQGYELFKSAKCSICHAGQNLGGLSFEYMGLSADYFADRGHVGKINDRGVASDTSDERDMHKFKTPTLRNVELTAPYFHDGSTDSLKKAVEVMSKYQRGRELSESDINLIVKFLQSLNGEADGKPLKN